MGVTIHYSGQLDDPGRLSELLLGVEHFCFKQEYFFVKTQFAPIEVHVAICELLRFVKDNYMPGLEVRDEGWYWETGDREKLAMHLGFISDKMRELMETKLREFKQLMGEEYGSDEPRVEMGKKIEVRDPPWKKDWGQSAGEN